MRRILFTEFAGGRDSDGRADFSGVYAVAVAWRPDFVEQKPLTAKVAKGTAAKFAKKNI
jgi:hypothetical protein